MSRTTQHPADAALDAACKVPGFHEAVSTLFDVGALLSAMQTRVADLELHGAMENDASTELQRLVRMAARNLNDATEFMTTWRAVKPLMLFTSADEHTGHTTPTRASTTAHATVGKAVAANEACGKKGGEQ